MDSISINDHILNEEEPTNTSVELSTTCVRWKVSLAK